MTGNPPPERQPSAVCVRKPRRRRRIQGRTKKIPKKIAHGRQAPSGRGPAPLLGARPARPLVLAAGGCHQGHGPGVDAARIVAGAESRQDLVLDDPLGGDVGDGALEAVADLDADLAVLREHEQDRAVVGLLLARAPLLRGTDGEVLERESLGHPTIDPDEDLVGGVPLELGELFVERLGAAGTEDVGAVGDEPRRFLRKLRFDVRRARGNRERGGRDREKQRPPRPGALHAPELLSPDPATGPGRPSAPVGRS